MLGRRDGHYDEHGRWQRDKFCFVYCGDDRCTCGPPCGRWFIEPLNPGSASYTTVQENSVMKLRITATHPTTRDGGGPFDPATELKHWRVRRSVPGGYDPGPFLPASQTVYDVPNVTVGAEMTAIVDWYDMHDQLSVKVLSIASVPPPAPPTLPPAPSPGDATYVTVND